MADDTKTFPAVDFSSIKLDRSRHYGRVVGEGTGGAHAEQDGLYFDSHGDLITDKDWLFPADVRKGLEDKLRRKQIKAKMEAEYRAKLAEMGLAAGDGEIAIDSPEAEAEAKQEVDKAFDIAGWAKGVVRAPFFQVKAAARAQHGIDGSTAGQIVLALIELGIVNKDDVKVRV